MVRVISVHNFQKQQIHPIDEVIDIEAAPPDLLLMVQSNHTIHVKNIAASSDVGYSIPTVDQVQKIIYSLQGNYIGTLEAKTNRTGEQITYVRIYLNWESMGKAEYNDNNVPMRARIAGRVTPSGQSHHDLELIEIPTHNMPDNLACCKISGNLVTASKNVLTVFKYVTQTHDLSKLYFIDFEIVCVDFQLSFVPTNICFSENIIAVQSDDCLHVFEIIASNHELNLANSRQISVDDFESMQKKLKKKKLIGNKTVNYEKLMLEERDYQPTIQSNLNKVNNEDAELDLSFNSEISKVNYKSFPILTDFPTTLIEKSLIEPKCSDVHRQNPFFGNKDLTVHLIPMASYETLMCLYHVNNILQYQLTVMLIGSSTNKELQEKFTCLKLKPYYSHNKNEKRRDGKSFESKYFKHLKSMTCFFATQQEGYLYSFDFESRQSRKGRKLTCCAVYPFTAPVIDVALEDALLHALTDTGLETYTVRAAQYLLCNNDDETCPHSDDPICLLGLRPFLNTQRMVLTNNYLSLLANTQEKSVDAWTLYNLKLPDPVLMWDDFLNQANENKFEAPSTYCHLIGEGHLILKTYLNVMQWTTVNDTSKNQVSVTTPVSNEVEYNIAERLYKRSCALLAECHILSNNHNQASKYYKMSNYGIIDVIRDVQFIYERIPLKYQAKYNESDINKALIYHLKNHLKVYNMKYASYSGNKEEFYTPDIGNFVTVLMDLLEKEQPDAVSDIVLESLILRDFGTDRILKIMKTLLSKCAVPRGKDVLSLALMCIQRGQIDQAKTVLLSLNKDTLTELLFENWNLLFEKYEKGTKNTFSELSIVLIEIYPELLSNILSTIVIDRNLLCISEVLNTFLSFLPSAPTESKNSTLILQLFLQNYFAYYFKNFDVDRHDQKIIESLKILIRIYLSGLQIRRKCGNEFNINNFNKNDVLFYDLRYKYLDKMPPFSATNQIVSQTVENNHIDEDQGELLLRLQSLLCYKKLPEECFIEVKNFLSSQPKTWGFVSLQALCLHTLPEITHLLIDFALHALLQFSKERVIKISDWKTIVTQLESKISAVSSDSRRKFAYEKVLADVLHYLAETTTIDELIDIFPNNYEDTEKYLIIAQNTAQANHIQTLIMVTGQQLLATL